MYCYFLISYTRGKHVPIENLVYILSEIALLWCSSVKSTAWPAKQVVRVNCFMTRGVLNGKKVENPYALRYISSLVFLVRFRAHRVNQKSTVKCMTSMQTEKVQWDNCAITRFDFTSPVSIAHGSFNALMELHQQECDSIVRYACKLSIKALNPSTFERQNVNDCAYI